MERLDDTRVLIVDDDQETLALYVRALEKMGAQVTAASDAASALAHLHDDAARPDIVLCDLHLPGTDGYELLAQIRAHDEDLPVVAISGSHPALEAERCKLAGFRDHLTKPVKLDVIVSAIQRHAH